MSGKDDGAKSGSQSSLCQNICSNVACGKIVPIVVIHFSEKEKLFQKYGSKKKYDPPPVV